MLLVGGGSIIAPDELVGVKEIIRPPFFGVANAVGAAMAKGVHAPSCKAWLLTVFQSSRRGGGYDRAARRARHPHGYRSDQTSCNQKGYCSRCRPGYVRPALPRVVSSFVEASISQLPLRLLKSPISLCR